MQKGLNSDIHYRGKHYHVQTEDWGLKNPYLVSRVYYQGAVVHSFRSHYSEALPNVPQWCWHQSDKIQPVLKKALAYQHKQILQLLAQGHFQPIQQY